MSVPVRPHFQIPPSVIFNYV